MESREYSCRSEFQVRKNLRHRTKPQLALEMLESALEAEVPARWVVADGLWQRWETAAGVGGTGPSLCAGGARQ